MLRGIPMLVLIALTGCHQQESVPEAARTCTTAQRALALQEAEAEIRIRDVSWGDTRDYILDQALARNCVRDATPGTPDHKDK